MTLTTNKSFPTGIVEDSSNVMRSLDINSLFTHTPLEETIETICTNNLFKINMVHALWI